MQIQGTRRFPCTITGIDISKNAMAYGKKVGLYDSTLVCDLNEPEELVPGKKAILETMKTADVLIATAALVYLDVEAIESIISSFASKPAEGYMLVNFLNPFALDKADETKKILLQHLDFAGSMATRHRKMSQLEQDNYPGEEWALLELWVLKRRV
jgi:predicted TPR repeat methyltransferase